MGAGVAGVDDSPGKGIEKDRRKDSWVRGG